MRTRITAAGSGSTWSAQMGLFMEMLLELGETPTDILGNAIYPAAGLVADEIRREIKHLPSREMIDGMVFGVSKTQKRGLLNGLGISSIDRYNGTFDVKIGFAGYNDTVTDQWLRGQPNVLIARSLSSGTSWLIKIPFVRLAVRRVREQAVKEMEKSLDHSFAEIQKKYEWRR